MSADKALLKVEGRDVDVQRIPAVIGQRIAEQFPEIARARPLLR